MKTREGLENSRQLCIPETKLRVCITVELRWGALIEMGFYLRGGGGGLISFRNDNGISSPKRTRIQSGDAHQQEEWRSCSRGSESKPNFQLVNKPSHISPHEVLQS